MDISVDKERFSYISLPLQWRGFIRTLPTQSRRAPQQA